MTKLVPPHGAQSLQPLLVPEDKRADELKRAASLKKVPMTSREVSDLFMLGMGAYTPLAGFMGAASWRHVCTEMKLEDGLFWPIPITLSATQELADTIATGEEVALTDGDSGEILGTLVVAEKYAIDKTLECESVFGTADPKRAGTRRRRHRSGA